jgi:ATP-binding protein involved in chromosome partitioning
MNTESQNGTQNTAKTQGRDKMTDTLAHIRNKLLVMSGKGGVGKSSVSASMAICLAAKGLRVGLLDVDIHGPSLAGIMGIEGLLDVDAQKRVLPKSVSPRLSMISMQSLMPNADQAVIWRGPAKTGVIRQFIGDVLWGDLDYLVIDAPPGTGDEPLSVAQSVPDAKAIIVTTPQQVALGDVRKSINFCRAINLTILGLLENMGPFSCPCCAKNIELFKSGGGETTATQMEIPFLGTLPFDPDIVKACDSSLPAYLRTNATAFTQAVDTVVTKIMAACSV